MAGAGRGRGASATLEVLKRKLAAGWPPGVVVLTGDNLYYLDRAQRALLETLVPAGTEAFGLTLYGDEAVDVSTVVAAARSVGMFSPRRVVLVRDVAALDGDPARLVAYAAQPPPASHLIVRAPQLDRRRKLHQALVQGGTLLEFSIGDPSEHRGGSPEVAELVRSRGLQLDREAQAVLTEIGAGDLYRVESELDKLRAWLGSQSSRTITVADLRQVAVGSAALSGWEVATALVRRDRGAALVALQRLLDAGEDPLRLLGGIAWRARALLQARAMLARGQSATDAVRAARLWGEPQAAALLAAHSLEQLLRFPALLLEADRTLKSRGLAPRAVLGTLLERMIPDGPAPRAGRRPA